MRGKAKVTIIGAGNVGSTLAHWLASWQLADIVLIDIVEGLPQGKALDLKQSGAIVGFDLNIVGTNSYEDTENSDVIVITAGIPRKPGMSRDELLETNCKIIKSCTQNTAKYSPDAIFIIVTNPLDAMVYTAYKVAELSPYKIVGQAGILDIARYKTFLAETIGVSVQDISALLIGGHGDDMVPLPRYTNVSGIPITDLIPKDKLDAIIERTRKGGGEIVSLLKTGSAYYAPSAATAQMVQAILKDQKRVFPCSCYCDKEYNVGGYFVGTPCILGANGVEKVIELKLTEEEQSQFQQSINHVKQLCQKVDKILSRSL